MSRRRTFAEVEQAARLAERRDERAACVEHIRAKIAEVDRFVERGRISADAGSMLNRRLDAVADSIWAGLHR